MNIFVANFSYSVADGDLETEAMEAAPLIRDVDGLLEKTFLIDTQTKRCGGVYKFADRAALDAYLASDFWADVLATPEFSDFDLRIFDVMEAPSRVTNAIPTVVAA